MEAGEVAFLKHTTVVETIATGQFGTTKVFFNAFSPGIGLCLLQLNMIIYKYFFRLTISNFCALMAHAVRSVNTAIATGVKFLAMQWLLLQREASTCVSNIKSF